MHKMETFHFTVRHLQTVRESEKGKKNKMFSEILDNEDDWFGSEILWF